MRTMPDLNDRRRNEELLEKQRRGILTVAEARELAQRGLVDDELFEDLILDGILAEALSDPEFRERWLDGPEASSNAAQWWWKPAWGVAIAAIVIVAGWALFSDRGPDREPESAEINPSVTTPLHPGLAPVRPALRQGADGQPILLAANLRPMAAGAFRGGAPAGRMPNQNGVISSVEEEAIHFTLGSADGIAIGARLNVRRSRARIAILQVDAVFRDRGRGHLTAGDSVEAGDIVEAPPDAHLRALWTRVEAVAAGGDVHGARRLAEVAVRFAEAEKLPLASAYWEAAGVLRLLAGESFSAREALIEAERRATGPGSRARALNNLGVYYETSGDLAAAMKHYEQALQAVPAPEDQAAIDRNLKRVKSTSP